MLIYDDTLCVSGNIVLASVVTQPHNIVMESIIDITLFIIIKGEYDAIVIVRCYIGSSHKTYIYLLS